MADKWKLDENGALVLKDGNPVYVDVNGVEKVVHVDTVTRLGNEAKQHRIAKEQAQEALKAFEGLDAEKARKALETVSKLDEKQLVESGKVEELKFQITEQFRAQLAEKDKTIGEVTQRYENTLINNAFAGSEFVQNSLAVPRDFFEAAFRSHFKVENGEVVAYDKQGNKIISPKRAGEYATPDEAFQYLVDQHPQKDSILRADIGSGTGNKGAGGNGGGAGKVIRRSDKENYHPSQWQELMKKAVSGEVKFVD